MNKELTPLFYVAQLLIKNFGITYKVLRDGKVSLHEIPDILNAGSNFLKMAEYLKESGEELEKLNETEYEKLKNFIAAKTEIDNELAEQVIEASLIHALSLYRLLKKGKK